MANTAEDPTLTAARERASRTGAKDDVKTPPRKRTRTAPPADESTEPVTNSKDLKGWQKNLHQSLVDLYTASAGVVSMFDLEDAQIIAMSADNLALSWVHLAEKDKKVRDALTRVTVGSAWSGVIIGHASIAIAIAAKHDIIPGLGLKGAPETPEPPTNGNGAI